VIEEEKIKEDFSNLQFPESKAETQQGEEASET